MAMHTRIVFWALALWCCAAGGGDTYGEGRYLARIGQSGEFVDLEHEQTGHILRDHLPLYRAGAIRYFSAGVGVEERQAEYPPFSLKLVFTAGGRPYLSGVDVTIHPAKGGAAIIISREQVEGPWLFVDLPPGTYDVSATSGGHEQALQGIKVVEGKPVTVHLRWVEDAGSSVKAPKN